MKNMLTRKKLQMATYIIGKAYDKKFLRRNIKKKLSVVDCQKKRLFSLGGKKKSLQTTRTLPPQISNGASLNVLAKTDLAIVGL